VDSPSLTALKRATIAMIAAAILPDPSLPCGAAPPLHMRIGPRWARFWFCPTRSAMLAPSLMSPSDVIRDRGEKPVFTRHKDDHPSAGEPATLPAGLADVETNRPSDSSSTQAAHRDRLAESDLEMPPFRPAPPKEAPLMASPPFTPTLAPVTPVQAVQRPTLAPARAPARDPSERRTLVVGRGISVQGTVQDAERLVVEGTVEASMIHATELAISPGGMFKGEVEVEDAEIAGTMDGTVTARGSLIVRATGRLLGTARCRRLQVEDGGQISAQMEMLTDGARAGSSRAAVESAA
jgi:cytoskeletal protein CcmA (bactofilin family)